MRLEVRRLRDLLSAKADAVFGLENRKQQLLLRSFLIIIFEYFLLGCIEYFIAYPIFLIVK